jgi:ABC-type molybdate transport system permease subunit
MAASTGASADDLRAAANIAVTLSEYLITVALAVIAAQAGLAAVFIDKRERLLLYYVSSFVALGLLVSSIVLGGKGIALVYHAGFQGQWQDSAQVSWYFNWQALAVFVGFLVALFSVWPCALLVGRPTGSAAARSSST